MSMDQAARKQARSMTLDINKKAGQLARQYRQGEGSDYEGGVVIVFQDQVGGWVNELRDPQLWEPGCIAVDLEGNQWVATGGNDYDGAVRWEAIPATNTETILKQPAQWAIDELKQLCDDVVKTCSDTWDAESKQAAAEDDVAILTESDDDAAITAASARLESCIADTEHANTRHELAQRRVIEFIDTYNEVHSEGNGDNGFDDYRFVIDNYVVTINGGATRHPASSVVVSQPDIYQSTSYQQVKHDG